MTLVNFTLTILTKLATPLMMKGVMGEFHVNIPVQTGMASRPGPEFPQ